MIWHQNIIELAPRSRGFHLITPDVLKGVDLVNCEVGVLHLFIQHTSASLAINENADPDDDTTSHIKNVMIGPSLTIPISHGKLALGTWQGIYLAEHRNSAGGRKVVATLQGRW